MSWNRWFAWRPVTLCHGAERCTVWLETVERRVTRTERAWPGDGAWEYRDARRAGE